MTRILRFIGSGLCLIIVAACAGSILEPGREIPVEEDCDTFSGAAPMYGAPGPMYADPYQGEPDLSMREEYVNYRDVPADYRKYGERVPRDHMITAANAGDNMSMSLPPMIDGEFVDDGNYGPGGDIGNKTYSAEDPVEDWLAEEGRTLKALLIEWSDKAGWRLVWKSNRNYTLTAGAMFRGRFADVSSALIRAFGRAKPAPVGTFYKGNRVLVVETLEDENAYE